VRTMQTRKENLDHHQVPFPKKEAEHSSPEAELIALAQSKHQVLAERTLQIIRETLELRGVSLSEFVADVRPHFRHNNFQSQRVFDRSGAMFPPAVPSTGGSCGRGDSSIVTDEQLRNV